MGKHVKNLYEKLHLQHDLLRSQNPSIVHRQSVDNDSMTQRLTARLDSISSWKYAPAPVKSLRNRAAGNSIFQSHLTHEGTEQYSVKEMLCM